MPSEPLRVGRRVVVRYRLPVGSQPPLTDVVGMVTSVTPEAVCVDGRRGEVTVPLSDIVLARAAPPPPVRRGRPHTAISTSDLERLMADGWRAVEEEWLGDWLLRASSGFTGRGNSVLPLGDPVIDLAEALERVEGWYQARGLPPQFHIDIPSTGKVADDSLGSELLSAGYAVVAPTLVMTGATSDIQPLPGKAPEVTVSPSLTPAWLHAYARQRAIVPGITEKLLTGSAGQVFLSVVGGAGEVTAVARLSVHPGWAGLSGLWVDPGLRGRGLGRAVLQAAAVVARQQRLPSMFLQVEAANRAATALYESEGFRAHHTYVYLRRPA